MYNYTWNHDNSYTVTKSGGVGVGTPPPPPDQLSEEEEETEDEMSPQGTSANLTQSAKNVTFLLDNLLKEYDNSLRPNFGGKID